MNAKLPSDNEKGAEGGHALGGGAGRVRIADEGVPPGISDLDASCEQRFQLFYLMRASRGGVVWGESAGKETCSCV